MKIRLLVSVLILVLLALAAISFNTPASKQQPLFKVEEELVTEQRDFTTSLISRAETFFISGKDASPGFTKEVTVDPFIVRSGEQQTFSIWAKDQNGVAKVTATVFTDAGEEVLKLLLVDGIGQEGRWQGSWITKDISNSSSYTTSFRAINFDGKDTVMNLFWDTLK